MNGGVLECSCTAYMYETLPYVPLKSKSYSEMNPNVCQCMASDQGKANYETASTYQKETAGPVGCLSKLCTECCKQLQEAVQYLGNRCSAPASKPEDLHQALSRLHSTSLQPQAVILLATSCFLSQKMLQAMCTSAAE